MAAHPEVVVVEPPRRRRRRRRRRPVVARSLGPRLRPARASSASASAIGFIAASYAARNDADDVPRPTTLTMSRWSTAESRWHVGVGTLALGTALTAVGVTRFVLVRRQAREAAPAVAYRSGRAACTSEARFDAARRVDDGGRVRAARAARAAWVPATSAAPSTRSARSAAPPASARRTAAAASPTRTARRRTGATFIAPATTPTRACRQVVRREPDRRRQRGRRARLPACARDESLWCWGRNDHGQLGDGTRTPRALPVRVTGDRRRRRRRHRRAHTCAVDGRRRVLLGRRRQRPARRRRRHRQRGLPRRRCRASPARRALVGGKDFSCALGADGSVRCWGDDSVGQLGDGGAVGAPPARAGRRARADRERCRRAGSTPARWTTDGAAALLGRERHRADRRRHDERPAPADDARPRRCAASRSSDVATGHDHTCALAADGLCCWGGNGRARSNPGAPSAPIPTPQPVTGAGPSPIRSHVAAGAQHTCIVRAQRRRDPSPAGARTTSGQLGDGTPIGEREPRIVAGAAFSCALASDGALFCWGDNHFGQLAIGGDTVRATPAPVPGLAARRPRSAAGGAHNCATADDANGAPALFCWGANGSGQLGNGSSTDAPAAARISSLAADGIAAGRRAHLRLRRRRDAALLGLGRLGPARTGSGPTDMVVTVPTVTDLAPPERRPTASTRWRPAPRTPAWARRSPASVLCFGLNVDGQLGNGTSGVSGGPDQRCRRCSASRPRWRAGDAHTCALDAAARSGAGAAATRASSATAGASSTRRRPAVDLGGGVDRGRDRRGRARTPARSPAGEILCWGRNADGQLGAPLQMPLLRADVGEPAARDAARRRGRRRGTPARSTATRRSAAGARTRAASSATARIDSSNVARAASRA